jgi:hypothetical protein
VEKFGGKEVGRTGQGGWIKGDLRRSGRRPPTAGRPKARQLVVTERATAANGGRQLEVARWLRAAACVDRARHFIFFNWDFFFKTF